MLRTQLAPLSTVGGVGDAAEIRSAEEHWKPRSHADELAAIHAAHVKRTNSRDRTLAELRVAQGDVGDRFEAALALLAISRSHTPAK